MSLTRFKLTDFPTRAAILSWLTKSPNLVPGMIVAAGDLCWQYLGTGTAISDMPGWVPVGEISPEHFKQNTAPGTTDMGAALTAAITYAASKSVMFVSPNTAAGATALGPKSLIKVDLRGRVCATTTSPWPANTDGVWLTNGVIKALAGALTASSFLLYLRATSPAYLSTFMLSNLLIDCNDICSGLLMERGDQAAITNDIWVSRIAATGVGIETRTKLTDWRANNLTIAEHNWSDAERVNQVDRTAVGLRIGTSDFQIDNIKLPYNKRGLEKVATGPGQIGKIHFYQGSITGTVTNASDIIGIDIQYPSGLHIGDIYAGNASIQINCDDLNGATGNKAMSIGRVQFFNTGAGDANHMFRFTTTVANNDMAGLKLGVVAGKDGAVNYVRWAPSGAGSFLPLIDLKWSVLSLTDAQGAPFGHTNDAGTALADPKPIFSAAGWLAFDASNRMRAGGYAPFTLEGRQSLVFLSDYDATGNGGFEFRAGAALLASLSTTALTTVVDTIVFGSGLATGGGPIANIARSGDKFLIRGSDLAGGTTGGSRLEFDPAKSSWAIYGHLVAAADFVQRMTSPPSDYTGAATLAVADFQKTAIPYNSASGANLQMPLGSALDAAFPDVATDQGIEFTVIAKGAGAATLTTNTGVTFVGSAVVAGGTSGTFKLRKTGTATWIVYRK